MCGGIYDSGMRPYPPRVALAQQNPTNQRSVRGVGISTPCVVVSTTRISVFRPGWFEMLTYGRISDPGMGPYPPRLPLAPPTPADQRSTNRIGVSKPCGAVFTEEFTVFVPVMLVVDV